MASYNIKGFDTINDGDTVITNDNEYTVVSTYAAKMYIKENMPDMEEVAIAFYLNNTTMMYGVAKGENKNVCSWNTDGNGPEKILDVLGSPPDNIPVAIECATAVNIKTVNGHLQIVLRTPLGNFTVQNGGVVTFGSKKHTSKEYPRFSKNLFEAKAKALMMFLKLASFKY